MIVWAFTSISQRVLARFTGSSFKSLDLPKQRNVVTYVLQFFGSTVALIAQLLGGGGGADPTPQEIDWMILSFLLVAILYIWELIYRLEIGWPLLLHHLITIILIQLGAASFFETRDVIFLRYSVVMCFHATTEQLTFLSLGLYRLQIWPRRHGLLFYGSALLSFLVKSTVMGTTFYFYAEEVKARNGQGPPLVQFWIYGTVPLLGCLYVAQIYSCYILYSLGQRVSKSSSSNEAKDEINESTEFSTNASEDLEKGREEEYSS